jgi:glycosyltransferase involved in cell wall biosynthesis
MLTDPAQINKPALLITRFPYESSWGGEESHTLSIARHFRDQGHEVVFMGSCQILLEKFKEQGFETKKVWAGKMIVSKFQLLKSFILFPFMKRSLKKSFKKLLKTHEIKYLYCLSLNEKLFLTPYAIKENISVTWVEHQEIRNWLLKSPWRKLYKKNSEKVSVVPISKMNEKQLLEDIKVSSENIQFIVNGIDVDTDPVKTKKEVGSIVFANRLIPKKGVMDFLECLKMNIDIFKDKKIYIVGEGEQRSEAEKFEHENLSKLDVRFLDYLKNENWKALLEKADIFVSCARDNNETFSLNTAEALSKSCKVVVTRCSGIASFLVDKKEAFLCEPKSPEDLAKKIQEAMTAPNAIREMASQAAKRKFDKKNMLKEYYQLITRIHD